MTHLEKISFALKDNAAAVELFLMIRDVLHFWDDLVDGDRAVSYEETNRSMFTALVSIPANSFYRQHQTELAPVLINSIANWHAANEFERTSDAEKLQLAFVVRSDYANLLIHMAYLVGGYDWVMRVTPMIRSMWTDENFSAYLSNLQRERAARRGISGDLVKLWYEQETTEYLSHGLTIFNAAMLGETEEEHVDVLLSWIQPLPGAVVVDMGCGVGGVSRLMAERDPAARFYGVTNVQAQVDAMSRLGGVEPVLSDYHNTPLADGVADVVMFNESIGYGDCARLFQEANRLLKPGGKLAIKDAITQTGEDIWSSQWQWTAHPKGFFDELAARSGFDVVRSHSHPMSLDRFRQFVSESDVMRDRYGLVQEGPIRPWFWLFEKKAG